MTYGEIKLELFKKVVGPNWKVLAYWDWDHCIDINIYKPRISTSVHGDIFLSSKTLIKWIFSSNFHGIEISNDGNDGNTLTKIIWDFSHNPVLCKEWKELVKDIKKQNS